MAIEEPLVPSLTGKTAFILLFETKWTFHQSIWFQHLAIVPEILKSSKQWFQLLWFYKSDNKLIDHFGTSGCIFRPWQNSLHNCLEQNEHFISLFDTDTWLVSLELFITMIFSFKKPVVNVMINWSTTGVPVVPAMTKRPLWSFYLLLCDKWTFHQSIWYWHLLIVLQKSWNLQNNDFQIKKKKRVL